MKRVVPIILLAAVFRVAYPWIRTYENAWAGRCVQQTTDGGYIVCGYGSDDIGNLALILIKTDDVGDVQWREHYIFAHGGYCVQETSDGGYVAVGSTHTDDAGVDLLLMKTDEYGDTLWTRSYGWDWEDLGRWVEQTSDGGYIITGTGDPTGGLSGKLWLLKTDEEGDTLWTHLYTRVGNRTPVGLCVQETNDRGYILTGSWGGDICLLKTNELGDSVWMYLYGGENGEVGYCVRETRSDGGYITTGFTESFSEGQGDVWLLKTDGNGDTVWTKTFGGEESEAGLAVQQTNDGGYVVVGETHSFATGGGGSDVWLLKTDANGDTIWTRTLGGGIGRSVQQTTDGGYIITGNAGVLLLIKTDSLGYVGVEEPPVPATHQANWEVVNPVGRTITLRYENRPQGFAASLFDATGRELEELHSENESGTIQWGRDYSPGVYFIRVEGGASIKTQKVVLIK